jgi:hypothetical protein
MNSIYEFVKHARDDYFSRFVEVVPGYEFSQYETLRTIELYHNSKFQSGNEDSLKHEKSFYNICKSRVNAAMQATHGALSYYLKRRQLGARHSGAKSEPKLSGFREVPDFWRARRDSNSRPSDSKSDALSS